MTEDSATPKQEAPPTLWSNLRALVVVMFCVPGAIGILDKYEDTLGLSELLKRIARNYEVVLGLVWEQIGRFIPLPPDFDVLFWSFFVLILVPVLAEVLRRRLMGKPMAWARPGFWGLASGIAFLGYAAAFSVTADLGLAFVDYLVFIAIFIPAASLLAIFAFGMEGGEDAPVRPAWRRILRWIVILAVFVAISRGSGALTNLLFAGLYERLDVVPQGGIRGFAILVSLAMAAVFAFGNLRTPAYVFFWALGLWIIDAAAFDILPAIREALDAALPPEPA